MTRLWKTTLITLLIIIVLAGCNSIGGGDLSNQVPALFYYLGEDTGQMAKTVRSSYSWPKGDYSINASGIAPSVTVAKGS